MSEFVHLHVHTQFSLLDGAARISELAKKAKEMNQKAIAITDHGVMYGVIDFYKACKKEGIKPIIGMEAYVAPRNMEDKQGKQDKEYAHLILLCKNKTGYENLCHLSTLGFTNGFYYKPRIDYNTLEKYSKGLIVLSACLAGDIPSLLLAKRDKEAYDLAKRLKDIFGDDFYIEIQDHQIEEEKRVMPKLAALASALEIKIVATNDVHYVEKQDAQAQDALMCIQTNKFLDEENRMKMNGDFFYLKNADEMSRLFAAYPGAIENTLEVAQKCNLEFEFGKIHLPSYEVPIGFSSHHAYLESLCEAGLLRKCGDYEQYKKRLKYELDVIKNMGYTDYFLIVWDFINYAKQKGIMVGPGRGSAAGSLAAFCLEITDIDPIKYSLLFERFLNPERISMPDIDVDFCYERRQEVIDYVILKYGSERVAQIITFGTMAARSAIRDVGRVLRASYGEVDQIAKLVPQEIGMTLEKAMKNRDILAMYESNPTAKLIIDLARKVEGLPRHASTHAAGVVISGKPIVEYLPLQKNDEAVTTQFPMGTIEELGLLKMDFLGLRTLTVIRDTLEEISISGKVPPVLSELGDDDPAVFELISKGETDGVFQLESGGMRGFLQQFKPDKFEDIIAGISLYRPGPMDQIPLYVERKFHPEKVEYQTPLLEPILNMTYGCMVYQEQVMQIVRDLAGYTLGQSDLVRRAMSKKKADVMAKERVRFVEGCAKNDISEKISNSIFDAMMDFAQYAFNKSHAAAYAVIAYQTAWLKAHYPAEFMASLINSFISSTDKVTEYIYSANKMGIGLLPPDVNNSMARFNVEEADSKQFIRFGLGAIKSVGVGACGQLAEEREKGGKFRDLYDFINRCYSFMSKRVIEALIKAGAFDSFGKKRAVLMAMYNQMVDSVAAQRKRHSSGQLSLFDMQLEGVDSNMMDIEYIDVPEYNTKQRLLYEKEVTGLYVTGHPLSEYKKELSSVTSSKYLLEAEEAYSGQELYIKAGGIICSIRLKLTRRNEQMAYITLEDILGQYECVVFPKTLIRYKELLVEDSMVIVSGKLNFKDDEANVILADEFLPLEAKRINKNNEEQSRQKKATASGLYLRCTMEKAKELKGRLCAFEGDLQLVFKCGERAFKADFKISVSNQLLCELRRELGEENVVIID